MQCVRQTCRGRRMAVRRSTEKLRTRSVSSVIVDWSRYRLLTYLLLTTNCLLLHWWKGISCRWKYLELTGKQDRWWTALRGRQQTTSCRRCNVAARQSPTKCCQEFRRLQPQLAWREASLRSCESCHVQLHRISIDCVKTSRRPRRRTRSDASSLFVSTLPLTAVLDNCGRVWLCVVDIVLCRCISIVDD